MIQNKATNKNNYFELRQKFPIVDQVEFRRVLGQNEIISSWSWPEASSVNAVFDTLSERKNRLKAQVNSAQIDAKRSGLALEKYNTLKRETEISEATYTILIEQVKTQSLGAGFRPDRTEIYEYASPPISPSAPKRQQSLALGAILGIFIGTMLSLLLARRKAVYYSQESLRAEVQAPLSTSIKTLIPLRNKSLKDINSILVKKPRTVLRDMAVEIHKSDTSKVVLTSSRAKLTGNDLARALALYMQSDSVKIAIIDFSPKAKKLDIDKQKLFSKSFAIVESIGNILVLKPDSNLAAIDLLCQKDFMKNIQALKSTVDLLFLCADDEDAISLLRALQEKKIFHIALAKTRSTKTADLVQMNSLLPIQGLLHE